MGDDLTGRALAADMERESVETRIALDHYLEAAALLAFDGRLVHVEAVRPDGPVVDATGAGDAWGAAFIHGLRTGLEPVEAARRANRLGARIVTQVGARPRVELN